MNFSIYNYGLQKMHVDFNWMSEISMCEGEKYLKAKSALYAKE